MNITRLGLGTVALALTLVSTAHAQWTDDSTMHQVVADGAGEQVQPKIAPTTDGGCYVSWFTSVSGYDVRLQRLDAEGNEMWAHNGILIADRGFSSTEDYGLDVDSDGNAVLAFRDDRFGGVLITVQTVKPNGILAWDSQFGAAADSMHSPDIATTSAGTIVAGWINNNDTKLVTMDLPGNLLGQTTLSDSGGDSILLASMHGSDNGSVIVSWIQYASFLGPKHLYAQKIDSTGGEVWSSRAAVYDGGSLQFGNFPEFVADGSGGAAFSWYDTANSLNVYAQHLLSDGSEAFPHNGAAVSTHPRERVSPAAAYDPATGSTYVAWIELDNNQSSQGVYAQHLDASGVRMWTDSAKLVDQITNSSTTSINVQILDGNMITLWVDNVGGPGFDWISARGFAPNGIGIWLGNIVYLATDSATRSRLTTAKSSDGFIIGAWQKGDFGVADIETHNINSDGSLGVTSCPADLTGEGDLNFLDVSAFLTAFAAMDPIADFEPDGNFNFLDVSAFLAAYAAGCP